MCFLLCVCVCVRAKLIDEENLFMECQAALHIPTLVFSDVTVSVFGAGDQRVRG